MHSATGAASSSSQYTPRIASIKLDADEEERLNFLFEGIKRGDRRVLPKVFVRFLLPVARRVTSFLFSDVYVWAMDDHV